MTRPGDCANRASVRSTLPTARGGLGTAIVAGHLLAVGGESPTGPMGVVESYNIARGDWSNGPSMRTPRHGLDSMR